MKKKFSLSLIMLTLCTSIFVGGCSCGKEPAEPEKPVNPNAHVILATDIALSTSLVEDAVIGTPIEITYTINPANTTDKTMLIQSTDTTIATVSASEVTDTLTSTITVTPVGVGTVNIVFTWNGTFDNDVESEDRTLIKATKIYVVGELGKETLNTPTGLNYSNGKLTWNKVTYGTDGISAEPRYELTLTGGATPTTPITLDTNEYNDLVLTAGVEYTAKVKSKPSDDYQNFYTASAYSDVITIYKLNSVDAMTVEDGVATWNLVDRANKYIVNVNGEDVATLDTPTEGTTLSFDTNTYFSDSVTSVTVKVKPICDNNDLIFDGEYSVNNPTIYQLGKTSNFSLVRNTSDNTATLSWEAVDHATNYILEIYEVGNPTAIITETLSTTSYIIPASFAGNYTAKVKATGDVNTLAGDFSSEYSFNKQDIAELTASLSNGVVTYSIADTHDCDIVFYIVDNTETKTKVVTDASGSFNVADVTDSTSYYITARLEPRATSNVLVSEFVKVGDSYAIEMVNNTDYTSKITWDRLNTAENYTIKFTKGGTVEKTDTVENTASGKVEYIIPDTFIAGEYEVVVTPTINTAFTVSDSETLEFTKLNAEDLTVTYADFKLKITSTNANIGSVMVYVSGTASEEIKLALDEELNFADKGYESGTYTISIRALPNTAATENLEFSSVIAAPSVVINVITNPTVASVSADGVVTWGGDATYASYNVYLDKGTANEVSFPNQTGTSVTLNVTGLANGDHTIYVEAIPANGYLPSATYNNFAFTKLSTVAGIMYDGTNITWSEVTGAGSYEVFENGVNKGIVNTNSFAPTMASIQMSNTYTVRPIGNGINAISAEEATEQVINKVEAVSDLNIADGKLTWTEEDGITYKMYVDDEEVTDGKTYNFAGLAAGVYAKVHVVATRTGYFDSDSSNIFYVKKLAKVTGVEISSTNKITYKITFDAVTGASGYIVSYNGVDYPLDSSTTELTVIGELAGGDYTITVKAISAGDTPLVDGTKNYNYINGDASEEKAFTKLSVLSNIAIVNEVLSWTDNSTAVVSQYEIQYAAKVEGEPSWSTRAVGDALSTDMSFITNGGTYLVKLRAVGNTAGIMTGDWSEEVEISKVTKVENLKVANGAIVWDEKVSGSNAYMYDVSVYTIDSTDGVTKIPFGEVATVTDTTYVIPAMAVETDYYVQIVVRNEAGVELASGISNPLKVIKLSAPLNFEIVNHQAKWTAASYADATYRLIVTDPDSNETAYDKEAGTTLFDMPDTLDIKTLYTIKMMAMGTVDSAATGEGYLNSDYTNALDIYKLAAIENLRLEDGIVKWNLTHAAADAYQPVDFLILLYKDGDAESSEDIILATNTTQLDLSYLVPGTYMIEFFVRGDTRGILNSEKVVLGDSAPITKLAAPNTLRMQKGVLVWDEVTTSTEVNYHLFNEGTQFIVKTAGDEKFYPEAEVNTVYTITIKATMPSAIFSDMSNEIIVSKLPKVTGFGIDEGKFVWQKVENASGYRLVLSYMAPEINPESGEPVVDPETSEPVLVRTEVTYDIDGGDTVFFAIPETLSTEYTVESIQALGNTTASNTIRGYFSSSPTILGDSFTPLNVVTGLTTRNGSFVWNTVAGASYYSIEILRGATLVKSDSTTTNTYTISDDISVPAGDYTLRVTPVSTSDTYVTTNISTETEFKKLSKLESIRIDQGYLTWNVPKSAILEAYNAGLAAPAPEGGGEPGAGDGGEGSNPESPGEGGGEQKTEFDDEVLAAYLQVAMGEYQEDAMTSKMYSLVYVNLYMVNSDNNKVVNKVVRGNYFGELSNAIRCRYFVDVEPDTWNIKINAKGNTVHVEDTASMKNVDGVKPTTYLTATKLAAPLSPIHYEATMIMDGKLSFTPVRKADNTVYEKYMIECNPVGGNGESVVRLIWTITDTTNVTNQVIDILEDLKPCGIKADLTYNINIRTYGTESSLSAGGADLFLNSDTPAQTALTVLGTVAMSVTDGVLSWTASSANYFDFEIQYEDEEVVAMELPTTQTSFPLDGDEYLPGTYKIRIKSVGDGITKISSDWTGWKTVVKLGELSAPVLVGGDFVWDNANKALGKNGYDIIIVRTRTDASGEIVREEIQADTLEDDATVTSIRYSLPDGYENYVQEGTYRSVWTYAIMVRMKGSKSGSYVNGDYCVESYAYRRLNTPSNINVTQDTISWNPVAGANGYQVAISGAADQTINVGSDTFYKLDPEFLMGIYRIRIRAIGTTPSMSSPASGYITSAWTNEINIVRVANPNLRVERGEILWNTAGELPIEATKYVKIIINGTELPLIEDIANNIGFDFDTDDFPGGEDYEITVQFIGNSNLINAEFPEMEDINGEADPEGGGEEPGAGGEPEPAPEPEGKDSGGVVYPTPLGEEPKPEDPGAEPEPEPDPGAGGDGAEPENPDPGAGGEGSDPEDPPTYPGFYYLSSVPVTGTFTKLEKPTITLTKVTLGAGTEYEEEVNAIIWDAVQFAAKFDVYTITEFTEIIEDDPETTEVDESDVLTYTLKERYTMESNGDLFGTTMVLGVPKNYFVLSNIPHEEYEIYIRAVGDDTTYISSTRSESIQIHIPKAPTDFKYDHGTGTISWENTTPASHIVLGIKTLDPDTQEYVNEVFVELAPGTTTYQLAEINEYQVRIKARLKFSGTNSYDSDYSDTVLTINYNLFASGSGTTASPYTIENEEHLNNIRYFLDRKFVLRSNIVLDAYKSWTIIGSESKPFTGQINGAGYTISGFYYTDSTTAIAFVHTLGSKPAGNVVFDTTNKNPLDSSAKIYNLGFDISMESKQSVRAQYFAGVAINNYGTINNVDLSGSVNIFLTTSPENLYGGAVANNYSVIDNVVSTMSIISSRSGISQSTQYAMVGGIAAVNYGMITKSGNSGSLKGQYVGGIVADNFNLITLSYNRGSVEAATDGFDMSVFAGGIAARNDNTELNMTGLIQTCYVVFDALVGSSIVVNNMGSNQAYAGGIVAQTHADMNNIDSCYAIVTTYSSTGTGSVKVASLIANVSTEATSFYVAITGSYAYSNLSSFVNNSASGVVTSSTLTGPTASTYTSRIKQVTSLSAASGFVTITNISIDASNLPRLNWEPAL